MAKCYFTGVEVPTEEMFILDVTTARKAVRELRRKAAAIELIMGQLNAKDDAEVYNPTTRITRTLRWYRLVSPTIAQALSAACPGGGLFMPWNAFKVRRQELIAMRKAAANPVSHADSSIDVADETGIVS
jgi:hypothetical protein